MRLNKFSQHACPFTPWMRTQLVVYSIYQTSDDDIMWRGCSQTSAAATNSQPIQFHSRDLWWYRDRSSVYATSVRVSCSVQWRSSVSRKVVLKGGEKNWAPSSRLEPTQRRHTLWEVICQFVYDVVYSSLNYFCVKYLYIIIAENYIFLNIWRLKW